MRTLQATTAQFGGLSFHTDNDEHPILDSIQQLIRAWILVANELEALLVSLHIATRLHIVICRRIVWALDWLEDWGRAWKDAGREIAGLFNWRLGYAPG